MAQLRDLLRQAELAVQAAVVSRNQQLAQAGQPADGARQAVCRMGRDRGWGSASARSGSAGWLAVRGEQSVRWKRGRGEEHNHSVQVHLGGR